MSRSQLGWRVPVDVWDRFASHVREEWGDTGTHVRFELETAMVEFIDRDAELVHAERLLRDAVDVAGLSSSTAAAGEIAESAEKRTVGHRVRGALKDEFKAFVDEHLNDSETASPRTSYGDALAAALSARTAGGRGRRVRDLVEDLIGGSTGRGRESEAVESELPTETGSLSTESESATTETDDTPSPDAELVITIADDLGAEFPEGQLKKSVASTLNEHLEEVPGALLTDYCEAVTDHLDVVKHPLNSDLYIPADRAADITIWGDMTKELRVARLRRLVAGDAGRKGKRKHGVGYRDVISLFEEDLGEGPSHQYAYELMEAAADGAAGLSYGGHRGTKQLRVDVSKVDRSILEGANERFADAEFATEPESGGSQEAVATDGGVPTSPTADD